MKRFFCKTNAYNYVLFVDDKGKAYFIYENRFDEPLTLDVAKNEDYSNLDGCKTAEECAWAMGEGEYYKDDDDSVYYENVVDMGDYLEENENGTFIDLNDFLDFLGALEIGEKFELAHELNFTRF